MKERLPDTISVAGIECSQETVTNWASLKRVYDDHFATDVAERTKQKWIFRGDDRKRPETDNQPIKCTLCKCGEEESPCQREDNVVFRSGLEKAFATFDIYDGENRTKWERDLIREFKRKARHHVRKAPKEPDVIEWLALMRHYGAPTRLLDFTYSFFVASYFAINKTDFAKRIGEVWAIDAQWLSPRSEAAVKNILGNRWGPMVEDARKLSKEQDLYPDSEMDTYIVRHLVNNPSPCVYNVTPFRLNERLLNQRGTFLLQGDIRKCFLYNLKDTLSGQASCTRDHIVRVEIRFERLNEKTFALAELDQMGINQEVLFPDLQGFAESLERRLAFPTRRHNPWLLE
ncbi:MAG TPA: FRG domain-containing protein [Sedimentisphaerales bacterium]|nr:FRG domain-containing protein [Sedimentisphaerales bacterium]